MYLEITSSCNLLCGHCAVRAHRTAPDAPSFGTLVALIEGFRSVGGRFLTLCGGEPLLFPRLSELIGVAERAGFSTTVFTNGLLVDDGFLQEWEHTNLRLAVSLDGPDASVHEALRGRGTFEPSRKAARLAAQRLGGDRTMISTVLTRQVLPYVETLYLTVREIGAGILYCGIFEPLDRTASAEMAPSAAELIPALRKLSELAREPGGLKVLFSESNDILNPHLVFAKRSIREVVGQTVKVQADGWAYPGPFYYDPIFRLGRPADDGWPEVISSPVAHRLVRDATERIQRVDACRSCFWGARCGGGSMPLTWAVHGHWDAPCPLCSTYHDALDRAAAASVHRELPLPS